MAAFVEEDWGEALVVPRAASSIEGGLGVEWDVGCAAKGEVVGVGVWVVEAVCDEVSSEGLGERDAASPCLAFWVDRTFDAVPALFDVE